MPVYKKDRDRWRVRIWLNGNRQDWVIEGTRREAEAFEARKRVELAAAGRSTEWRTVPTFRTFTVERYAQHAALHLKPSWASKQGYLLKPIDAFFGDLPLDEIDVEAVEEYAKLRKADGLKATSVNNEIRVLTRVLNYAREVRIPIPEPHFRQLHEGGHKETVAWTDAEMDRLLGVCAKDEPALLPVVVFLANTGARKGEALALEWRNVDVPRRMIRIWPSEEWQPKSGKPREVPISDTLLPWLEGTKRSDRWVFPSRKRERYVYWPQRAFDRARDAADLVGGVHTLRHTFATWFLREVPDLFLLARLLGHSDAAVTKRYAHLLPDHLARARNAVQVGSPVGPAANEARLRWRHLSMQDVAGPYPPPYPETTGTELTLERDTGFEPATFSLGSSKPGPRLRQVTGNARPKRAR